ncbi:MAG: hypothetical protein ETSY1_19435 [Candidatus Entotheonella factor]|uniref:Radical SAM core domain-containing protein n=2 Tax=Candidatus Entotheonella TaxID=93171 RepID=W4LKQ1_ENTF1|nr:MAG: hypothetical protein ETSY1_19435 [Candidatus Entotheonella factor]
MEARAYSEFSHHLHAQSVGQRLPITGTVEVTRRCPLTCAHCYNNLPMGDRQARAQELTYDEHCRLIDEMVQAGCLWLLYTGGEIFARPDFLDIYTYAKQQGLLITLFTNGTLITPAIADALAHWRPFAIEITLYGYTKATYERLTGRPGTYERCLHGIHLLLDRGLPLKLKTVAVTLNQHEIWDIKHFAQVDLGVDFKFDAMMNPRIDCSQSPLQVRLQPQEVVALDLLDPERVASWRDFATQFSGPVNPPERHRELYHCGGGVNGFAIDPYGQMSICVLSHCDTYDLRQGSFQEGWSQFLGKVRRKKMTRFTKCTACGIKAMCGMCPANGELENGDPESPVEFLCQVAHLRAYVLGLDIPPHGPCAYCPGGEQYESIQQSAADVLERPSLPQATAQSCAPLFPIL